MQPATQISLCNIKKTNPIMVSLALININHPSRNICVYINHPEQWEQLKGGKTNICVLSFNVTEELVSHCSILY